MEKCRVGGKHPTDLLPAGQNRSSSSAVWPPLCLSGPSCSLGWAQQLCKDQGVPPAPSGTRLFPQRVGIGRSPTNPWAACRGEASFPGVSMALDKST